MIHNVGSICIPLILCVILIYDDILSLYRLYERTFAIMALAKSVGGFFFFFSCPKTVHFLVCEPLPKQRRKKKSLFYFYFSSSGYLNLEPGLKTWSKKKKKKRKDVSGTFTFLSLVEFPFFSFLS